MQRVRTLAPVDGSEIPVTRRHATIHLLLSAGLVASSIGLCVAAGVMGKRHRFDIAFYILPLEGRGHASIVGASPSMALATVSVASAQRA